MWNEAINNPPTTGEVVLAWGRTETSNFDGYFIAKFLGEGQWSVWDSSHDHVQFVVAWHGLPEPPDEKRLREDRAP